jgi:magnesium transporter
VNTAIQVALAMVNMGHGEITKRLAAYAALVAVPTMIAGVYGMNFEHMPELHWSLGYPLSIGLMAAIDAFLFFRFRKAGWL